MRKHLLEKEADWRRVLHGVLDPQVRTTPYSLAETEGSRRGEGQWVGGGQETDRGRGEELGRGGVNQAGRRQSRGGDTAAHSTHPTSCHVLTIAECSRLF